MTHRRSGWAGTICLSATEDRLLVHDYPKPSIVGHQAVPFYELMKAGDGCRGGFMRLQQVACFDDNLNASLTELYGDQQRKHVCESDLPLQERSNSLQCEPLKGSGWNPH